MLHKFLLAILLPLAAHAAAISTITCTGGVATVTVANTLVASQGFEITGSSVSAYNLNATAISANSTSFTFAVACNGSATGGTFTPAQQIIVLSITPNGAEYLDQTVFWNTTTVPTACPACTSLWPLATGAQIAALKAGTTVETAQTFHIPLSESTAQMNTLVTGAYASFQTAFASGLTQFVNYCYNGTTWSSTCN